MPSEAFRPTDFSTHPATSLMFAIGEDDMPSLVKTWANSSAADQRHALFHASRSGKVEAIQQMLKLCKNDLVGLYAQTRGFDSFAACEPLTAAITADQPEVVRLLLHHLPPAHVAQSAIMAAYCCQQSMFDQLLQKAPEGTPWMCVVQLLQEVPLMDQDEVQPYHEALDMLSTYITNDQCAKLLQECPALQGHPLLSARLTQQAIVSVVDLDNPVPPATKKM